MWLRFQFKAMGGKDCGHYFYCLGPYHLKEILDRYNISFEDMEYISIGNGQTISRSKLRELFKTRRRQQ